ncbi:MAG: hypothetical protein ACR2QA_17825 [Solirubrobacteraceae bacterium]
MESTEAKHEHRIAIFIDGERFEVHKGDTTASALLALVSKPSADWYLVHKHGRKQTEYRGSDVIEIKSDERFLTVFTGPTPVS